MFNAEIYNEITCVGSIPPTGIPLPFISAGGTSLMVFMGAIGVLCNVGKNGETRRIFADNKLYGKIINGRKSKRDNRM